MNNNSYSLSALALMTLALTLGTAAQAQSAEPSVRAAPMTDWYTPAGGRYMGIDVSNTKFSGSCGSGGFGCEDSTTGYSIYAGGMWNKNLGLEIGATDFGKIDRAGGSTKAYGFSLKAVGVTPLTESLSAFAKAGTLYSRSSVTTDVASSHDNNWGLTYGVGLSFDFTPKVAATLSWDRSNVHFAGSQEHINATSVGLKYRF
jgi:opacity protein-like surface antigen